jgi:hypothetical protein
VALLTELRDKLSMFQQYEIKSVHELSDVDFYVAAREKLKETNGISVTQLRNGFATIDLDETQETVGLLVSGTHLSEEYSGVAPSKTYFVSLEKRCD